MIETQHAETVCQKCDHKLNTSAGLTAGLANPEEGDISICLYCGEISIYRSDLTLRKPTEQERDELKLFGLPTS